MNGTKFKNSPMASDVGNSASVCSSVTLAAQAADSDHQMVELPLGAELEGVELINDGMGADTTLQVGVLYPDGNGTDDDDLLLAASASTTAGRRSSEFHPFETTARTIITLTNGNTGAATGKASLIVRYTYRGTM